MLHSIAAVIVPLQTLQTTDDDAAVIVNDQQQTRKTTLPQPVATVNPKKDSISVSFGENDTILRNSFSYLPTYWKGTYSCAAPIDLGN